VKLPSHAAKQRSGTRGDFARQTEKLEAAAAAMVARHRAEDDRPPEPDLDTKHAQRLARLERDAAQLRTWLAAHPDERRGAKGAVRKSNRTDNESAKMATGQGVIQGYTGVAVVDGAHQIIVEAQAHGTGSEQELLLPVVTALAPQLGPQTLLTADAGYHSEANLQHLAMLGVDALIADGEMRRRDARFATQAQHHATKDPLHDKSPSDDTPARFQPSDFQYQAGLVRRRLDGGAHKSSCDRIGNTHGEALRSYRDRLKTCESPVCAVGNSSPCVLIRGCCQPIPRTCRIAA
jgi:hypothetical protein